jgi:hypothetical protein
MVGFTGMAQSGIHWIYSTVFKARAFLHTFGHDWIYPWVRYITLLPIEVDAFPGFIILLKDRSSKNGSGINTSI